MAMVSGQSHWLPDDEGVALRETTLGHLLSEQARRVPDRPAIIFDEPDADLQVNWTYADLDRHVDQLSKALIAIGVKPADRVAVLSPNRPEWVLFEYALARIGAILVTVNPAFRKLELDYLLTQGRISVLVSVGEFRGFDLAGMLSEMIPDLVSAIDGERKGGDAYLDLRRVIALGRTPIIGALSFADLLKKAATVSDAVLADRAARVTPDDVVQIQYTSGTTGNPKGAMLTHRGTVNNALLATARAGYRETDVMVSAMPFFHTAGCVCNVMGMVAVGGCLVPLSGFDAATMLDLMERYRGTLTNGVPTMYIRLLQDPKFVAGERDISSYRIAYIGGTSIPPSLMVEVKEKMGADPCLIMGMTECSPIITQTVPTDPLEKKVATAGVPLPHTEVRVVDPDTSAIVPTGREGELQIRGYLVMAGYFEMPEKTAETIDPDGWLKSGDLAVLDEGGYLRIVGRIKDMLIRGGENIYPVEIEEALLNHPDIAEAQVVGVPDDEYGEEIFAFVVPRDGRTIDTDAVRAWCRSNMARHKLPRYLAAIEAMPQTANGKVRKVELRQKAADIIKAGTA
ncbi:AMP-binding protein [Amorphus orientalis]|uniref:3-methylmercaptopropionyl-CoA ligase n=1 Tax=Amorphus orientalis TaxID=649198 RepID=A0AAE3VMJ1_9HYPH|nr:AMP-binding protein [Amorphus orientalis]MDQ0314705.1 fatty-acyl-CoA synthase [Amorphus orientalis]